MMAFPVCVCMYDIECGGSGGGGGGTITGHYTCSDIEE